MPSSAASHSNSFLLQHATAEQLSDFMAELNTMAAVSGHRNIVRLIGASPSPPRQCIVMELCRGTLFDVLHGAGGGSGGGVGLSLRVAWAQDVARAIAFLHGRRPAIIHRDVKRWGGRSRSSRVVACQATPPTPRLLQPELPHRLGRRHQTDGLWE